MVKALVEAKSKVGSCDNCIAPIHMHLCVLPDVIGSFHTK